jgi:hypothetical protein
MATGRIGVTPVLRVRWSLAPAGGTTALSGLDDNSVALVYDAGYEAVYRNGVLLSRGNDYTATDGTTVTLTEATITGDIIEIFANDLVPLTDAISKGQYNAKGALLSATAASTPAVLPVGTNGQVLTAASGESTGLQWATVAAGANWSLLNAGGTALTGAATITVSGISGKNQLFVIIDEASSASTQSTISIRFNSSSTDGDYTQWGARIESPASYSADSVTNKSGNATEIAIGKCANIAGSKVSGYLSIDGCNTSGLKMYTAAGSGNPFASNSQHAIITGGFYSLASTISSVSILSSSGNFDAGFIYVYASA